MSFTKFLRYAACMNIIQRPRRNRKSAAIRSLVREHTLTPSDLIKPLFIHADEQTVPLDSMPGQFRFSVPDVVTEAKRLYGLGIPAIDLFPKIDESLKTDDAKESFNRNGLIPTAIKAIKEAVPELMIMTDVALDPYSTTGHDGLVDPSTGVVLNDKTVEVLVQQALMQAEAGADIIGPSDMMDGRVLAIREALDEYRYKDVLIMSYTAKYASAYYGPFRGALDSAPKGDNAAGGGKDTYQMDPANSTEALREMYLDIEEGADMVMVKPGGPYLDVVARLAEHSLVPVTVYQVSGEYLMITAAANSGWLERDKVIMESLIGFKRAGASGILTYFADEAAQILNG